jgi:hypothetical protein
MTTGYVIPTILEPDSKADAVQLLCRYYGTSDPATTHTGASFEVIGHIWNDQGYENEFTPSDLLALSTLSVPVEGRSAVVVMSPSFLEDANSLLAKIPNIEISDPDAVEHLALGSPGSEIWKLLRSVPGFGPVSTSKLLARKRLGLLPIYDAMIDRALGLDGSRGLWLGIHEMVTRDSKALYEHLVSLRDGAHLPQTVTPLRALDVILWRNERDRDDRRSRAAVAAG